MILTGLLSTISACKSKEEIRYEQFVVTGRNLYLTHCSNCHGKDGEGLKNLYPAINNSKKLADVAYINCLIKGGTTDKETNMPANKGLYDIDIAQIITFLNNKWGKSKAITEIETVQKVDCP